MVCNEAAQALKQAEDVKQKVFDPENENSSFAEQTVLLSQLQKAYQKVLLMDLDYALDRKVEQDLWNFGFKNRIESLQRGAKDKKNPNRAECLVHLSYVLQAATGFYITLLHQICITFKLNLPYRCNIPYNVTDMVMLVSSRPPQPSSCWYISQHCLVHLGDLARYSHEPKRADSFYRQALSVSPRNGQPYNQLGLLRAARGDRLGAAYFHVRGLAVGGPFAPAANNLNRTLAASSSSDISNHIQNLLSCQTSDIRITSQAYISSYILVHFCLQTMEKLDQLSELIGALGSNLTALVAIDEMEAETLVKMCCLDMYSLYSVTDGHKLDLSSLTDEEKKVFRLSMELIAGTLVALIIPVHTRVSTEILPYPALSAIKILLEWIKLHTDVLKEPSFVSKPQLWPGLCTLLNRLQESIEDFSGDDYSSYPLPEDEELQGFLPIDGSFNKLKYPNSAQSSLFKTTPPINEVLCSKTSSKYDEDSSKKRKSSRGIPERIVKKGKDFSDRLRAFRLIQLGTFLMDFMKENGTEHMTSSEIDGVIKFSPVQNTVEVEFLKTVEKLSLLREKKLEETQELRLKSINECEEHGLSESETKNLEENIPETTESVEMPEKGKDKPAGILKPQGSLEKARCEKALLRVARIENVSPDPLKSAPLDKEETGSGSSTVSQEGAVCTDVETLLDPPFIKELEVHTKKEGKKVRTNVALQSIVKKQEETSKQVKFLTPATTPDSIGELSERSPLSFEEKKIIQPKVLKSLVSFPTDRKTGGILSLKDKSAGYPHLVKTDSDTKLDLKVSPKGQEKPTKPQISPKLREETPKTVEMKKAYMPWNDPGQNNQPGDKRNLQERQMPFSFFTSPDNRNPGITLPVVNPKEIDIRSAALQKQKNVENPGEKYPYEQQYSGQWYSGPYGGPSRPNLPPRLANLYKNKNMEAEQPGYGFNQQVPGNQASWNPQMQNSWWPNQEGGHYQNYNHDPSYYYNPKRVDVSKLPPPAVMYPQFSNKPMFPGPSDPYPPQFKPQNYERFTAPPISDSRFPPDKRDSGAQSLNAQIPEFIPKNMDQGRPNPGGDIPGNPGFRPFVESSYSLFSGGAADSWNSNPVMPNMSGSFIPQQSLWSGPGPSPLERLLEQQKQHYK